MLGPPLDEKTGERRTVVVMVANEGVMDLVLNFICSAAEGAADIDVTSLLVFLGQPEYVNYKLCKGYVVFFGLLLCVCCCHIPHRVVY